MDKDSARIIARSIDRLTDVVKESFKEINRKFEHLERILSINVGELTAKTDALDAYQKHLTELDDFHEKSTPPTIDFRK